MVPPASTVTADGFRAGLVIDGGAAVRA